MREITNFTDKKAELTDKITSLADDPTNVKQIVTANARIAKITDLAMRREIVCNPDKGFEYKGKRSYDRLKAAGRDTTRIAIFFKIDPTTPALKVGNKPYRKVRCIQPDGHEAIHAPPAGLAILDPDIYPDSEDGGDSDASDKSEPKVSEACLPSKAAHLIPVCPAVASDVDSASGDSETSDDDVDEEKEFNPKIFATPDGWKSFVAPGSRLQLHVTNSSWQAWLEVCPSELVAVTECSHASEHASCNFKFGEGHKFSNSDGALKAAITWTHSRYSRHTGGVEDI
jgi:hypothetical protein